MNIAPVERGIVVTTSAYRLLLEREGGYAAREVEVLGEGRLDRFDRPGEGKHPTCMYFDNVTVNDRFQLAYYGKPNDRMSARVTGATVKLSGSLVPITTDAKGEVRIEKTMRFQDGRYDADVKLRFEGTGSIAYVGAWWDVNDKWTRAMRSGAGVFMPLRVGIGDSFGENLCRTWRSMKAMADAAGVWMEVIGTKASILVALKFPSPGKLRAGGMKFWDGPDDAVEGEGVSHGCINLDVINCELARVKPLRLREFAFRYRVFVSGPTVLRK